jgi:Uma2 family endonuclease
MTSTLPGLLCWPQEHLTMVTATRPRARRATPDWKERRLTLDEFLALPEEKPALEFEDGKATQKVSPKARHSGLQTDLAERFNRLARRRKLARAFAELRVTLEGQSYVPDISVFRWERIPRLSDGTLVDDVLIPPDITVEIVSPGQRVNALVRRCLRYVGLGVQIALLVDPDDESVVLFRRDTAAVALRGPDPIELDEVLPGFKLTVAELFKSLRMV